MKNWKIADPDRELNRIVRQAFYRGPQRVTLDDEILVVVVGAAEYARLTGEPLPENGADSQTAPESGLSLYEALRRPFEEAAARGEDVYWPWDWDCEKREWIIPAEDAVPAATA
jgi:hypothetical protein